jgi:hypothetical protein
MKHPAIHRPAHALPLAAWLLALALTALPAAADEVDLLQDLDAAMAASAEKEQAAPQAQGAAAQFADNLDLTVRLRGAHFLQTAGDDGLPKDTQDNLGEVRLEYATSATVERVRLVTSGWIEAGNQQDTYAGVSRFFQDDNRRRNAWEINELYAVVDLDAADLTLGRKVLQNGISTLVSPANRYSPVDFNDPLDPRRLGVWQAALDVPDGDTTWTVALMPFFTPPKTPSPESRWVSGDAWGGIPAYFGNSQGQFDDFLEWLHFFSSLTQVDLVTLFENFFGISFGGTTPDITTRYDLPDADDPDQWSYLGRVKTTMGGWDLFASAFRGPSIYPVMRADLNQTASKVAITVEHPVADQLASGFSTTWKELEFHGEALYSHTEDGKDDSYLHYVGGSTWSNQSWPARLGLHRFDLTAEYVGESITHHQNADGYFISSRDARLGRNDAVLRAELFLTEDVSLHYLADILLSNSARMHRVGTTWRMTDNLTWHTAMEIFDGPGTSYYGRWRDQDRVVTTLEYRF